MSQTVTVPVVIGVVICITLPSRICLDNRFIDQVNFKDSNPDSHWFTSDKSHNRIQRLLRNVSALYSLSKMELPMSCSRHADPAHVKTQTGGHESVYAVAAAAPGRGRSIRTAI
ncbi:hypothetical protein L596_009357 [Steinernema carpocapsae]|uniref:Uncharacterized protein n=1 Tax=Steinernema carpocapsae TaxID=34508 RepID=A0A4U5PF55_STECR|nr:hypothetical protein L596_009357 [Steinernema carpocapsae]